MPGPSPAPDILNYRAYVRALEQVPQFQNKEFHVPEACRQTSLLDSHVWEGCIEAVCNEDSLQKLRPTSNPITLDFFVENVMLAIQYDGLSIQRRFSVRLQPEYVRYSLIKTFKHILCEDPKGGAPLMQLSRDFLDRLDAADTILESDNSLIGVHILPLLALIQPVVDGFIALGLRANPVTGLLFFLQPPPSMPEDSSS